MNIVKSSIGSLLVAACLLVPLAGCGQKEDPTKLPGYKDATEPANMPKMPSKPGGSP